MREFINLVEDALNRNSITPEWREAMVAECQKEGSMFNALHPSTTGLNKTIYVSENDKFPTVIIDSRIGKFFSPTDDATALAFGEHSNDPQINAWLALNLHTLISYCRGDYDSIDLAAHLKKLGNRLPL